MLSSLFFVHIFVSLLFRFVFVTFPPPVVLCVCFVCMFFMVLFAFAVGECVGSCVHMCTNVNVYKCTYGNVHMCMYANVHSKRLNMCTRMYSCAYVHVCFQSTRGQKRSANCVGVLRVWNTDRISEKRRNAT